MLKTPKRLQGVKKKAHNRSPKQEKEIASRLGGKTVKGSGCGFDKGDVRVKNVVRIEAKCTQKKSFSITQEMINKIEDAACAAGELPFMEVEFLDQNGKTLNKVAVCPTWVIDMAVDNGSS